MKKTLSYICALAMMAGMQGCQQVSEAERPLEPIKLEHGQVTATFRVDGEGCVTGGALRDPITGVLHRVPKNRDSVFVYNNKAYRATKLLFRGIGFVTTKPCINGNFPLILIPGETLTLDVDMEAVELRKQEKAEMKDCYRLGGTIGDINQVLWDNLEFEYQMYYNDVIPAYTEGQTFAEWSDLLWHSLDTLKSRKLEEHPEYTRRQRDFLGLLLNNVYVDVRLDYINKLKEKMRLGNPDSTLVGLKETYTLVDAHFKDLKLYRDETTFYLPLNAKHLEYLEANGMNGGKVYEMVKGFAEAREMGRELGKLKVQTEDAINAMHPHFQPVLSALNDSIRMVVKQMEQVAESRMMPTPEVTGDKILETIVAQHPGKVVFVDMWATWCGPCMKGLEAMKPLKEKLKERDVVFVYLTNETSPEGTWKSEVAKTSGLHYRIPNAMWNQIPNIKGVPQYYLYDRKGKRVWEATGFGNGSLKMMEDAIGRVM